MPVLSLNPDKWNFSWALVCVLGLRLVLPGWAIAQAPGQQQPVSRPSETPTQPATIAPSDVAERSESLNRQLRDLRRRLEPTAELSEIEQALSTRREVIESRSKQIKELLSGAASMRQLKVLQQQWDFRSREVVRLRVRLNEIADALKKDTAFLDGERAIWQATLSASQGDAAQESLSQHIGAEALGRIRTVRSEVGDRLRLVVSIQARVVEQELLVSEASEQIQKAVDQFHDEIWIQDSPPLWRIGSQPHEKFGKSVKTSLANEWSATEEVLRTRRSTMVGVLMLFLTLLATALAFRRSIARSDSSHLPAATKIFDYPFSIALLLTTTSQLVWVGPATNSLLTLGILLPLVPLLRLLPHLIPSAFQRFVSGILVLMVLTSFRHAAESSIFLDRILIFLATLSGLLFFGWVARDRRLAPARMNSFPLRVTVAGIGLGLLLLSFSLLANLFGYFVLCKLLGAATLLSAYIALLLYTEVRILGIAFSQILDASALQSLTTIRLRKALVLRMLNRAVAGLALVIWLVGTLDLLTIRQTVLENISNFLTYPVPLGKVQLPPGKILTFVLILVVGFPARSDLCFGKTCSRECRWNKAFRAPCPR